MVWQSCPVHFVKDGVSIVKEKVPYHLFDLLEYFDSTYVSGPYKVVQTASGLPKLARTSPTFGTQIGKSMRLQFKVSAEKKMSVNHGTMVSRFSKGTQILQFGL